MDEPAANTDLREEVTRSRLLGVSQTNIDERKLLSIHGGRLCDPLVVSIFDSVIIVFEKSAILTEEIDLVLSQADSRPLGPDGIQSETLRGRLEWERILALNFRIKIDLLGNDLGHEYLIFEPVHDLVFLGATLARAFAPLDLELELGALLVAGDLGLLESLGAVEVPSTSGVPLRDSVGVREILLRRASFHSELLAILDEIDFYVLHDFFVVFDGLGVVIRDIVNMNIDANVVLLEIDFADFILVVDFVLG